MKYGVGIGSFADGFMRGYTMGQNIEDRRLERERQKKEDDRKEKERKDKEAYARAVATSFGNAGQAVAPYIDADVTDPEFGLKAAYPEGPPHPGVPYGLQKVTGTLERPDMPRFYGSAIKAAGAYNQAGAIPGLVQGYAQSQERAADRQWREDQAEESKRRFGLTHGLDVKRDQRAAAQERRQQAAEARAVETHGVQMKANERELANAYLNDLAGVLDAYGAVGGNQFINRYPEVLRHMGVDETMQIGVIENAKGQYNLIIDDGQVINTRPFTSEMLRRMAGQKGDDRQLQTIYKDGREQKGYFDRAGKWVDVGGTKTPTAKGRTLQSIYVDGREQKGYFDPNGLWVDVGGKKAKPQKLIKVRENFDTGQIEYTTEEQYLRMLRGGGQGAPAPQPTTKPSAKAYVQRAMAKNATRAQAEAMARKHISAGRLLDDLD